MGGKQYYVYILTNRSGTLYVGVTSNLLQRIYQHKQGAIRGFTQKYRINRLIYYEVTSDVMSAIKREKQLKGWLRKKKIQLVESKNPEWKDLSVEIGL